MRKDSQSLKIDIAKNQEYLVDLIGLANRKGIINDDAIYIDRSNLKIPVKNIEELLALESNDEHKKILVSFEKIYNYYFI